MGDPGRGGTWPLFSSTIGSLPMRHRFMTRGQINIIKYEVKLFFFKHYNFCLLPFIWQLISMCSDCKAPWGKFVICDIGLYKINGIRNVINNVNVTRECHLYSIVRGLWPSRPVTRPVASWETSGALQASDTSWRHQRPMDEYVDVKILHCYTLFTHLCIVASTTAPLSIE